MSLIPHVSFFVFQILVNDIADLQMTDILDCKSAIYKGEGNYSNSGHNLKNNLSTEVAVLFINNLLPTLLTLISENEDDIIRKTSLYRNVLY